MYIISVIWNTLCNSHTKLCTRIVCYIAMHVPHFTQLYKQMGTLPSRSVPIVAAGYCVDREPNKVLSVYVTGVHSTVRLA
jgi:hypothetical protein